MNQANTLDKMFRVAWTAVLVFTVWTGVPSPAEAGPHSEICSAFDDDDPFDLNLTLGYDLKMRSSRIIREDAGQPGADPNGPTPLADDLVFTSMRHTLTPRLSIGLFRDFEVSITMPVVLFDSRSLSFDTSVNSTSSTTVRDGILPAAGYSADDPSGNGFSGALGSTIFEGPIRAGLDQLYLGFAWAPMNQQRDETKPTWKIGAEYRLGIGKAMELNRDSPTSSTGVGRGLNEVRIYTSIARDIGWAEPYVYIWWQAPVSSTNDSLFIEPGFGQVRAFPQQQAGTQFGFEAFAVNNKEKHQKVAFELALRIDAHFEGRDYTDMWEVFQYAGDAAYGGPLMLDSDPTAAGPNPLSHPGVTNVENYLTFTARAGFHATLSEYVRFGATFEIQNEQGHLISFADAGKDKATCSATITTNCETNNNDLVNQGTDEVNPLHSATIDTVGRRYKVMGAANYLVSVQAQFMF